MNQLIRQCILGLSFTFLAACGGGGGGGGGNDAPSITSGAAPSVIENTTAVATVTASDADGDSPTFSITGGADEARFNIVATTGVLTFTAAPDFETPADAGADNIYNLQVTAADGNGGTAMQNIAVTVSDTNDAPSITSSAAASVPENTTAVITVTASDDDGDSPTFSITGGADAAWFTIVNATGVLTFATAPDFETPADVGADNVYDLQVTADDGDGGTVIQDIALTVSDANDAPIITSGAFPWMVANTTAVTTVTASDVDGDSPTFTISGGADNALFSIDPNSGALTFNSVPSFAPPGDDDSNNIYNLQVTAADGNGGTAIQNIAVTVTNIAALPGIYGGALTAPNNPTGLITSNGKLVLIDRTTLEAVIGTIYGDSISGTLFSASVIGVTGTISSAVGNNITGTYSPTGLGTGSFNLDANLALHSRGADLTKLAGTWVDSIFTGITGTTTWVFQEDGSYVMTSTSPCNGSGQFYLIDATRNEYEMDLTISDCGPITDTYTGIGMLSKTSHDDDTLTFMFINSGGMIGGLYEPIKQ